MDSGYGTSFYIQSSASYLHGFYNSYKGHAPLVPMDQLFKPGRLCI